MRNMSFAMTVDALLAGEKTVTRRIGWKRLKPGDRVCAVRKSMGLAKGEKVERLAIIRITDVRRERLAEITSADVAREGLLMGCGEFIRRFERAVGCSEFVTRIEFHVEEVLTNGE